jgi:hypothetical protein
VEDCSIAGYEEEEYGDSTRLPYGVQRTRTPDSLVSRYRPVGLHSTATYSVPITFDSQKCEYRSVLRIHDILVWIWIRIRRSKPLTNGSGSGSWIRTLLFLSLTFKIPTKNLKIKKKFFCLLLYEGASTSFFKEKKNSHADPTDPYPQHWYRPARVPVCEFLLMADPDPAMLVKTTE